LFIEYSVERIKVLSQLESGTKGVKFVGERFVNMMGLDYNKEKILSKTIDIKY